MLLAATLLALVVFSGVALAATISCVAGVECLGTTQADTLNGSLGDDFIFGRGSGDTLKGFGGTDFLYGQGSADKVFGGPRGDLMIGGPGNDALSGEEDSDRYYFGDGWGKDFITDNTASSEGSSPAENVLVFSNGPRHAVGARHRWPDRQARLGRGPRGEEQKRHQHHKLGSQLHPARVQR